MSALTVLASLPAALRLADAESLLERTLRHEDRLALGWPELEAALPEGSLPRGVIEIASPRLHGATSVALSAVRAAHEKNRDAWCAWIDPDATLFSPGVAQSGVDLARLLVVRPDREAAQRVAVKAVDSGAFDIVVVDADSIAGARDARASSSRVSSPRPRTNARRPAPPELFVRKLAVAAEPTGARVLLLTDASSPRAMTFPVAMRIEIEPSPNEMRVRVTKDRRGRAGLARAVPYDSRPTAAGVR